MRRSQSEKGGDRLQNLISKYRGYSEAGGPQERKIKPLSIPSSKMGLVTKGRSFGPAAPKSDKEVSEEEIECCESRVPESHNPLTSSHTSDAFAKASSPSFLAKEDVPTGPVLEDNNSVSNEASSPLQEKGEFTEMVAMKKVDVGAQIEGGVNGVQSGEQTGAGEEGGDKVEDWDEEEQTESGSETEEESDHEQRDIDALIDR